MSKESHGQLRRSQLITTYGPGALIDLPNHAAIVGSLETWGKTSDLEEIQEPRLVAKLAKITEVPSPRLYSPPLSPTAPFEEKRGVTVWKFPEWFVVQEEFGKEPQQLSRRLVHRLRLDDNGRFDNRRVFPTRFVRTCGRGHVDDLDWFRFVHGVSNPCRRQLWLDEKGTSGDLADLTVRCECDESRILAQAAEVELNPLGFCSGARPWIGRIGKQDCKEHSRLLIRTAANAYFPQVVSVLSLPDRGSAIEGILRQMGQAILAITSLEKLRLFREMYPTDAALLQSFQDEEILEAIQQAKTGKPDERPVKQVELEALLNQPLGYGDDVPIDPNFHARKLPERAWRKGGSKRTASIECVVQLHRLREVLALAGFSRLEAITPDIQGEYSTDVARAELALEPEWFPAVENRGEGIFLQLRGDAIKAWEARPAVVQRLELLKQGHARWWAKRKRKNQAKMPAHPGVPYILLHTLSHLLLQSLSMRCGYPASSIRERIYVDDGTQHYGILLYTGSPDAEGTLGGLVQQARHLEDHLLHALQRGSLCSNDPICSQHVPSESSLEGRDLQGAACHGCTLIAETSCEMRNDHLDRALVVPVLGTRNAAFFDLHP